MGEHDGRGIQDGGGVGEKKCPARRELQVLEQGMGSENRYDIPGHPSWLLVICTTWKYSNEANRTQIFQPPPRIPHRMPPCRPRRATFGTTRCTDRTVRIQACWLLIGRSLQAGEAGMLRDREYLISSPCDSYPHTCAPIPRPRAPHYPSLFIDPGSLQSANRSQRARRRAPNEFTFPLCLHQPRRPLSHCKNRYARQ